MPVSEMSVCPTVLRYARWQTQNNAKDIIATVARINGELKITVTVIAINIADACRFIEVFTNAPNLKDSTFDFTASNTSLSYAELATHPAPACIASASKGQENGVGLGVRVRKGMVGGAVKWRYSG